VLHFATPHRKVFFQQPFYESSATLIFLSVMHKKVYMQAMRLVFVLLEKLGTPFFELDQSSIGGNEKVKIQLIKTYKQHYVLNLWEN
jgi:hypothetical protein